ncbi:MAG: nucleotide exchange factor GrpE [Candidatus Pacebacteria bacterium]|jgi:molecular chaperone GrpE|nr:nucleotide exchange factor GrpE [Candidatus Paceibacterota bacterium]
MNDDEQKTTEELEVLPEELESGKRESAEGVSDDVSFEELNEDGDPIREVKKLKERLNKALEEKQEYLTGWQRERADLANYKKDEESRRSALASLAREKIILDLMPVLDAFDMAMGNKDAWEKADKNWRMGVEYIYNQLVNMLEKHSVQRIGKVGEVFDPNKHESVETLPTDDASKNHTIEKIIQSGYMLAGRIIRPARVRVWE